MKIISRNVNGIRAIAKKWFIEFIESESPDIICLQETKAFEEQFLKEIWNFEWYNYIWHSGKRPGYAGTAIFYKENIEVIDTKNHFDEIEHFHSDGRITEIEFIRNWENIILVNWYYPNWWQKITQENMLDYKLEFYDHMLDYSKKIKKSGKQMILTWDFNICHQEIDIARPKENENSIWFLAIERDKIWELINDWNIDVWRYTYPDKRDTYSWWSYRAWARPRNVWWRIDYFIINDKFINEVKNIDYMTATMGSDHCPVRLELK